MAVGASSMENKTGGRATAVLIGLFAFAYSLFAFQPAEVSFIGPLRQERIWYCA